MAKHCLRTENKKEEWAWETSGATSDAPQHSYYKVPEGGRRRERGPEAISEERVTENFPNMEKETTTWVKEAQTAPGRINPRRKVQTQSNPPTNTKDNEENIKSNKKKSNN